MDQRELKKFNTSGRINYLFSLLSINKSFRRRIGGNMSVSSKNGLIMGRDNDIVLRDFECFVSPNIFKMYQWEGKYVAMIYIDINELKDIPKRREDIYNTCINLLFLIERINKLMNEYNETHKENDTSRFYYASYADILEFNYNGVFYKLNDYRGLYDSVQDFNKKVKTMLSLGLAKEIIDLDLKINKLIDEAIAPYLLLKEL